MLKEEQNKEHDTELRQIIQIIQVCGCDVLFYKIIEWTFRV